MRKALEAVMASPYLTMFLFLLPLDSMTGPRTFRAFWGPLVATILLGPTLLSGCALFDFEEQPREPERDLSALIQTDETAYDAYWVWTRQDERGYAFELVTQLTNPYPDTLYLDNCRPNNRHPIYAVRLVSASEGAEVSEGAAYDPGWACVGHNRQLALAPGATRVDTMLLSGPNAFDGRTGEAFGVREGRMQIRFELQQCRGSANCRLPDSLAVSNAFDVRIDPTGTFCPQPNLPCRP